MPASGIDFYLQDARNNFDAVRPAPIPTNVNVAMGQCQNIHISTNCYYGYHDAKSSVTTGIPDHTTDCEMVEVSNACGTPTHAAKKRSADSADLPQSKRPRQEVQRENIEPETIENVETSARDMLELLYWNIHGGNMFHLKQCL